MAQKKNGSLRDLQRTTDLLSGLLAKEAKALDARRRVEGTGDMKALKEITAVLKDLAAEARSLGEQGGSPMPGANAAWCCCRPSRMERRKRHERTDAGGLAAQPRQRAFMERPEPEALYGGAAGGGKSDALVIEALRQVHIPHYRALILRKTFPQLSDLMDKSMNYYRQHAI